jgi:hypothetical protein
MSRSGVRIPSGAPILLRVSMTTTKKLKIGFFGHSDCTSTAPESYIGQIIKHFDAIIVNKGVNQASEERVLIDLKKHKNLDVAVIFHSRPASLFLPRCNRDIDIRSDEIKAYIDRYGDIPRIFKTEENFVACIRYYRQYLYTHNLHINRFQGALLLIDSYCLSKVPATIHVLDNNNAMPWFTGFRSGVRATEVENILVTHKSIDFRDHNGMTAEGNNKTAEVLIDLISKQLANK